MRIPGFTAEVTVSDKTKHGYVAQARPYGDDRGVIPQQICWWEGWDGRRVLCCYSTEFGFYCLPSGGRRQM